MRQQVISVFDRAAMTYARPWFVPSVGLALRSFTDEVNRASEDNPVYKHPDDFELYHLGFFEDVSGTFDMFPEPVQLAIAKNLVIKGA